jgi:1-carboxybiuret hydrolase
VVRPESIHRPAAQIAASVRTREISAREIVATSLQEIERCNPALRALTDLVVDRAFAEADAVDAAVSRGAALPLAGVPFVAKNLFDIKGIVTRAGSMINRANIPAGADATLISRLTSAGAVLVGSANMGEYAYDFMGENIHDGDSLNPHDLTRMSGGSSGGSAAAVASGMVPLALGTDTNGSIRVPASFCGLFGLKPTYGRLSRAGAFLFAPSLDHAGILSRSAQDLALSFDTLQGADPRDPSQAESSVLRTAAELGRGVTGLRIAVAGDYFRDPRCATANAAVDLIAHTLGVNREIALPEAHRARAAAFLISAAEATAQHLARLRTHAADYDPHTRPRFLAGAAIPAAWVLQAQRFRRWFRERLQEVFLSVDAVLAPTTPYEALASGTRTGSIDDHDPTLPLSIGTFTQPISFIGLPVLSVPVWSPGARLPIGVQIIAPAWREDVTLRIAHTLEDLGVCQSPIAALSSTSFRERNRNGN